MRSSPVAKLVRARETGPFSVVLAYVRWRGHDDPRQSM